MLYAQPATLPAVPARTGVSTIGRLRAAHRAQQPSCAQAKGDARDDSQQPAEHGAREDDPDQGSVSAAGHPAQLHLARVRNYECDQDDQERDETERKRVEASAVAVSPEPFAARLDAIGVGRFLLWERFDLHDVSFS